MEISDRLDKVNSKEKEKFLTKLWRKVDWGLCVRQMTWEMNIPQCSCNSCDPIYEGYLAGGKELYKNDPQRYRKIVAKENALREERKLSRELDRRKYTRSVLKRVSVFN